MSDLNRRAAELMGWEEVDIILTPTTYKPKNTIFCICADTLEKDMIVVCFPDGTIIERWSPTTNPAHTMLLLQDKRVVYYSITWHKGIVRVELKVKHPDLDHATLKVVKETDVLRAITAAFVAAMSDCVKILAMKNLK